MKNCERRGRKHIVECNGELRRVERIWSVEYLTEVWANPKEQLGVSLRQRLNLRYLSIIYIFLFLITESLERKVLMIWWTTRTTVRHWEGRCEDALASSGSRRPVDLHEISNQAWSPRAVRLKGWKTKHWSPIVLRELWGGNVNRILGDVNVTSIKASSISLIRDVLEKTKMPLA